MNDEQVLESVADICEKLFDLGGNIPEHVVYMSLGLSLENYVFLRSLMISANLIFIRNWCVGLTSSGISLARKLKAVPCQNVVI